MAAILWHQQRRRNGRVSAACPTWRGPFLPSRPPAPPGGGSPATPASGPARGAASAAPSTPPGGAPLSSRRLIKASLWVVPRTMCVSRHQRFQVYAHVMSLRTQAQSVGTGPVPLWGRRPCSCWPGQAQAESAGGAWQSPPLPWAPRRAASPGLQPSPAPSGFRPPFPLPGPLGSCLLLEFRKRIPFVMLPVRTRGILETSSFFSLWHGF